MKCIYFDGECCRINPANIAARFKPSKQEIEDFCGNAKFPSCPRFRSYIEYLNASSKSR
jgi:hypothetical protein